MKSAKLDVMRIAQRMYREGLVAGSSGNVSMCSREDERVYITPSDLAYDLIQERDIVVLGMDGTVLEGDRRPSSEWKMHLQIYRDMQRVCGVVHTHSTYATTFAAVRRPIELVLIEMAAYLGGGVPVARFEVPGSYELGKVAVESLNEHNACLLSNHGAVIVGSTLDDAYLNAIYLEDAAKIYYNACILGEPVPLTLDEIAKCTASV